MTIVRNVLVSCEVGNGTVNGQIAAFTKRTLAREFCGKEFDRDELYTAVIAAVKRVRNHLKVGAIIEYQEDGVVQIRIHHPTAEAVEKPVEAKKESDQPLDSAENEEEEEDLEIPPPPSYWPIQGKKKSEQRWGRTPGSKKSWRRR